MKQLQKVKIGFFLPGENVKGTSHRKTKRGIYIRMTCDYGIFRKGEKYPVIYEGLDSYKLRSRGKLAVVSKDFCSRAFGPGLGYEEDVDCGEE